VLINFDPGDIDRRALQEDTGLKAQPKRLIIEESNTGLNNNYPTSKVKCGTSNLISMASQRIRAFISSRMQDLAAEREAIKTSLNDLQVDTFRVRPDRSRRLPEQHF
jgi:hypothetical protein